MISKGNDLEPRVSAAAGADRHTRVKITINLDGDVINHFKAIAKQEGRPYQSLINQVLREHILGSRPEQLADQVQQRLLANDNFLSELAKKNL